MKSDMVLSKVENTPQLETERLILRKFTKDDTVALFQIFQDKDVNTYLPWFPLDTVKEAQAFLQERFLVHYRLPNSYHYAVCFKSDNIPIGYVNISDNSSHDLGYGLSKEFWNKGIMTEACSAVIQRLCQAEFPFITATHDVENPGSGEVMKKIGMTYRYSYEEQVQPKDVLVTFRMYQLNFNGDKEWTYNEYWDKYPVHYVEQVSEFR